MEVGTFLNYRDCLLLSFPRLFSPVQPGVFHLLLICY